MSLFNTMRTSVSGMAAQSSALSTIGDNIANTSTTGYKAANTQFETLLGQSGSGSYESGSVQTNVRYGITDPGALVGTTSPTDLAIKGNGFFLVSKNGEGQYLTRAGSFVPDSSGNLVNSAGYQLMGYPLNADGTQGATLTPINVSSDAYQVASSSSGILTDNLNSQAAVVTKAAATPASAGPPPVAAQPAVDLPADNTATSKYSTKTSVTVYDNLGTTEVLDIYYTKTSANTWQADVYQQNAASPTGGFPYSSGPLKSQTLTFAPTNGVLTSPGTLTVPVSGLNVVFDISATTQLATDYSFNNSANGNAPSKLSSVSIGKDGTLTDIYGSGVQIKKYQIPIATVTSPNNLTTLSGNVYQVSQESGPMNLNKAGSNGTGDIASDTLEQSTADLATELTNMIQAQRAYEANSKVLQAGSDLLGVLNRITTN